MSLILLISSLNLFSGLRASTQVILTANVAYVTVMVFDVLKNQNSLTQR